LQLRRAFGTIHEGHCYEGWDVPALFEFLSSHLPRDQFPAAALALEETEEGNLHIQFYIECKPKRPSTLAKDFLVTTPAVFDIVRDASGSWDYCTGAGRHEGKPAFERVAWGTPVLYGGTARADLKILVDLIIGGSTLNDVMREYPYAYCVHRSRLLGFYTDWNEWPSNTQAGLYSRGKA